MYKKFYFFFLLIFISSFSVVYATPTINSFTVGNSSAFSGQLTSLSWSGSDTGGYNLLISCAAGVKVKSESGTVYPCDTKFSTSSQSADSLGIYLINYSGSTKSVTFMLYPKSVAGDEYASGVQTQTISVSTAVAPLSSVSASASSTKSGVNVDISWTSYDLDGVNIIFSCVTGVSVYQSGSSSALPCGNLAYTDKLAGSGTNTVLFKNTNNDRVNVTAKILPYIGNGTYDMTHALSLDFDVATDKTLPSQILSFVSSQPKIASGDPLTFLWSTKNVNGINLKIDCVDGLTYSLATSSGGQSISCGSLISDTYFAPNSSAAIVFNNTSKDSKIVYISLLPQLSSGGFDGINAQKIAVTVNPKGETVIYNGTTTVVSNSSTVNSTSVKKIISPRKKFQKILTFGVKSDDVSALQEFLYKNGYYPEGFITGYMGALTTRAVQRFQEDMGVVKKGQTGYGNVGPATRAKLNSL